MTGKNTQPRTQPRTSATSSSTGRDLTSEVGFLTRALKAPTLRDAVPRLAERSTGGKGASFRPALTQAAA